MTKQARARGKAGPGRGNKTESHDASPFSSLKELGIKKDMSSRWQRLAESSLDRLERTLKTLREAEQDLTTAAVLRALRPEPLPVEGRYPGGFSVRA